MELEPDFFEGDFQPLVYRISLLPQIRIQKRGFSSQMGENRDLHSCGHSLMSAFLGLRVGFFDRAAKKNLSLSAPIESCRKPEETADQRAPQIMATSPFLRLGMIPIVEHARAPFLRFRDFLKVKFCLSHAPKMDGEGQAFEGRSLYLSPLGGTALLAILETVQFCARLESGGSSVQFFIERGKPLQTRKEGKKICLIWGDPTFGDMKNSAPLKNDQNGTTCVEASATPFRAGLMDLLRNHQNFAPQFTETKIQNQ
jgi:hypothetical protein